MISLLDLPDDILNKISYDNCKFCHRFNLKYTNKYFFINLENSDCEIGYNIVKNEIYEICIKHNECQKNVSKLYYQINIYITIVLIVDFGINLYILSIFVDNYLLFENILFLNKTYNLAKIKFKNYFSFIFFIIKIIINNNHYSKKINFLKRLC